MVGCISPICVYNNLRRCSHDHRYEHDRLCDGSKSKFFRVTRIAKKNGQAVIFKNNRPKYMIDDLDNSPMIGMTDDKKIGFVAARIQVRQIGKSIKEDIACRLW